MTGKNCGYFILFFLFSLEKRTNTKSNQTNKQDEKRELTKRICDLRISLK